MYKEDIIKDLSRDTGLRYYECARMLDALVDIIWDALKRGEEVRINNLGVFHVKYMEGVKRFNLAHGQVEELPPSNRMAFRFSNKEKHNAEKILNEAVKSGAITYWQ